MLSDQERIDLVPWFHEFDSGMARAWSMAAAVLALAALSVATRASSSPQQRYRWTLDDGIVQFGVPETDDRAIRLECDRSGKIVIMGPTATAAAEGAPIRVTITGSGKPRSHIGEVTEMGDGMNFLLHVSRTDDAISTLVAGKNLSVTDGVNGWTVPGRGAANVLKPMLSHCARRRR